MPINTGQAIEFRIERQFFDTTGRVEKWNKIEWLFLTSNNVNILCSHRLPHSYIKYSYETFWISKDDKWKSINIMHLKRYSCLFGYLRQCHSLNIRVHPDVGIYFWIKQKTFARRNNVQKPKTQKQKKKKKCKRK